MNRQIRQYAPDGQATSVEAVNNPETIGSTVSGSQGPGDINTNSPGQANESGPVNDSDEDESGVDRRGGNADETGPGENMATES